MKGYLLNFYKFSPTIKEDKTNNESDDFVKCIVWGEFDRLEVKPINQFSDYRLSGTSEKSWIGERQFAMIYEFGDDYKNIVYKEDKDDKCRFCFCKQSQNEQFRFFGITFIDFLPETQQYFYKQESPGILIHKIFKEAIDEIIIKNDISRNTIDYELYGVLGGQDVVIIWLSYQIDDIAKIIEGLRKSRIKQAKPVIANVYTVIGLTDINNNNINYDDVNAEFRVKLTKSESYNEKKFEAKLKEEQLLKDNEKLYDLVIGEYDLIFTIKNNNLISKLYAEQGIFYSRQETFKECFIQSQTEIVLKENYSDIKSICLDIDIENNNKNDTKSNIEMNKMYSEKIIEIIKDKDWFDNLQHLEESLWLLYQDFIKNTTSAFSYPWTKDLEYQFENCLFYLHALIKSEESFNTKFENIRTLLNSMRQMMLHVGQANRIFFEIPNTHLKHTGAYSKILHSYYGIVKKYLKMVYAIPRYDKQSLIIPFISFGIVSKATSYYCDNITGYNNKIIRIELPYEALTNIPKYAKLLAHEIFHYVAPPDRAKRNILIGKISFSMIIGQLLLLFISNKIIPLIDKDDMMDDMSKKNTENITRLLCHKFRQYVLQRGNLEDILKTSIPRYNEKDDWKDYFYKFSKKITSDSGKLIIQTFCEQFEEWIKEEIQINLDDELLFMTKIKQFSKESLLEWLKDYNLYNAISAGDSDLRYALREAVADIFMIQVTDMTLVQYIDYIYDYYNLIDEKQQSMRQCLRLGFVLYEYCSKTLEINCIDKNIKNIQSYVRRYFQEKYHLEGNYLKLVVSTYVRVYVGFGDYMDMLHQGYFSMYSLEQYQIVDLEIKDIWNEIKNLFQNKKNCSDFRFNINFIEKSQYQDILQDIKLNSKLKGKKKEIINKNNLTSNPITITGQLKKPLLVRDLPELLLTLSNCVNDIWDISENSPIWFRGQTSREHLLIPSLYRMKDGKKSFYNTSMSEMLKILIDLFKAKSYFAPELIGISDNVDTNYLISMQHYSVPTNILDWSNSAFVALYFALENEMNNQKGTKENAAIYLLNPTRLNHAADKLESRHQSSSTKYPITAFVGDDKRFEEYLPKDHSPYGRTSYPRAVYAPYVNQRIKAQLGTFTIFSLYNEGSLSTENSKDYTQYSLENMQEEYKDTFKMNNNQYKPFLVKIEILGSKKKEIADSLRKLGIQKQHIYPELSNIGESLTKEVKAYYSK
jgi:FRG domain.